MQLSETAWQAISALVVAVCGALAAVANKRQKRVEERRADAHSARRKSFEFQEAYHRATDALEAIAEQVRVAQELARRGLPANGEFLAALATHFPGGQPHDYLGEVQKQLAEAERLQQEAEGEV